jgi:integrase
MKALISTAGNCPSTHWIHYPKKEAMSMADSNTALSLEQISEDLKLRIASQFSSQRAKRYTMIVDGFIHYYNNNSSIDTMEAIARYYTIVTEVKPYERPETAALQAKTRIILMLRDALAGIEPRRMYLYATVRPSGPFTDDVEAYVAWMRREQKSAGTIYTQEGRVKPFLSFLEENGIERFEDLTPEIISGFIGALAGKSYSSSGSTNILYTLRNFLSCPHIEKKLTCNPIPLLSGFRIKRHERLASYYTHDEVRMVLEAVDRRNSQGKMLYLMMLLAAVYGLRSGDIRRLKMSSIHWREHKITLHQQKTNGFMELPLTDEVRLAILDYIKNARPDTDNSHIFIKQHGPHEPYAYNNRFTDKVSAFFKKANVKTEGKHHGLHAMRHSLATELLNDDVPISEIATILGHSSSQSTTKYIWSDLKRLKVATMEVAPYGK